MARGSTAARWRVNPGFVQAFTLDGCPYIAKDTEPYIQFWLSERDRRLLALFGQRGGCSEEAAIAGCLRLQGPKTSPREAAALARAAADMRSAGVLVRSDSDTSRYNARIVADYVAHRPFPAEVAAHLVRAARIGPQTRVLDLAGGPGDLALSLAHHSQQVSLMELSKGFLAAAGRRAREAGVPLQRLHDSCNRLVFRDEAYDAITVSQALHWLDDVLVCRGVCRVLAEGGSFFVVHSAIDLPDSHPLAYLLGHDSILGKKKRQSFVQELQPLQRRLALLFEALDAPEVQRIDPDQPFTAAHHAGQRIASAGAALFKQRRPFGEGYARGFLTPQHIAATGQAPAAFWAELQQRCAQARPADLMGTHHWAVLQFKRGAQAADAAPLEALKVRNIGFGNKA